MTRTTADFGEVFSRLKAILEPYASRLTVVADRPDNYYLNAGYSEKWKRDIFFAAVQIKKNYVSYHLFPVYMHPELLAGIAPALRTRMQGKACFNFSKVDEPVFKELARLTKRCVARFHKAKLM